MPRTKSRILPYHKPERVNKVSLTSANTSVLCFVCLCIWKHRALVHLRRGNTFCVILIDVCTYTHVHVSVLLYCLSVHFLPGLKKLLPSRSKTGVTTVRSYDFFPHFRVFFYSSLTCFSQKKKLYGSHWSVSRAPL